MKLIGRSALPLMLLAVLFIVAPAAFAGTIGGSIEHQGYDPDPCGAINVNTACYAAPAPHIDSCTADHLFGQQCYFCGVNSNNVSACFQMKERGSCKCTPPTATTPCYTEGTCSYI